MERRVYPFPSFRILIGDSFSFRFFLFLFLSLSLSLWRFLSEFFWQYLNGSFPHSFPDSFEASSRFPFYTFFFTEILRARILLNYFQIAWRFFVLLLIHWFDQFCCCCCCCCYLLLCGTKSLQISLSGIRGRNPHGCLQKYFKYLGAFAWKLL